MKPPEQKPSPARKDFIQRSSLYQEFLAEREEILRHKWLESEKAGYDIGFERALLDWIRNHRENWRARRRGTAGPLSRTSSVMSGKVGNGRGPAEAPRAASS
ncbi:MAG: hypothetical protein ACFBZ8_05535 [Opitutales bacterium]